MSGLTSIQLHVNPKCSVALCYQWNKLPVTSLTPAGLTIPPLLSSCQMVWDAGQVEVFYWHLPYTILHFICTYLTWHILLFSAECYIGTGRWYNGTVNVTKSGKPCQMWSANKPQVHKRPPSVYRELENSENYCRNPGAEEKGPWCYINSEFRNERWELCDIPSCGMYK